MQAKAPDTKPFGKEAFTSLEGTDIRWLGNAGVLINSRGTTVMIDPVLSGFDMPLLIDMPITEEDVPHADAVLLTHCDNDHYSRVTCKKLAGKVKEFHAPHYVAGLIKEELGIDVRSAGTDAGEIKSVYSARARQKTGKTLIVYFSQTGNTEGLANLIQEMSGSPIT